MSPPRECGACIGKKRPCGRTHSDGLMAIDLVRGVLVSLNRSVEIINCSRHLQRRTSISGPKVMMPITSSNNEIRGTGERSYSI